MGARGVPIACAAALLVACSGGAPPPAPDGGTDPAIAAAALPALAPCPAGWREVAEESGLVTCDPWPASGRADCVLDERHLPGTPGCAPVGAECPPDGWPASLPSGRPIVYVDDDAAPGGDGSTQARALTRVSEAVFLAPEGAVIAVATGRYDGAISLGTGQSVIGACAEQTVLTSSAASDSAGVVTVGAAGVELRDVSIVDPMRPAILATGGDGTISGVVVRGASLVALYVAGAAALTARDVVVDATRPSASGAYGRGAQVQDGGRLVLERAVIVRSREVGLALVGAGSTVEARDLAVLETTPGTSGEGGIAILAEGGAGLTLARAALERDAQDAIFVRDGATADVEDVVIRDVQALADGTQGLGVHVEDASVSIRRALIVRARQIGVFVAGPDGRLDATAIVVRDTAQRADGTQGRGIELAAGARATIGGAWLERNTEIAMYASGEGSAIDASDLTVVDTRLHGAGRVGRAIGVEDGAAVTVARARIERSYSSAIFASRAGSVLEARDVIVRDTRPEADGSGGRALGAQEGARVVVERALLEDSTEAAIVAIHEGTSLEARDVVVRRVRPDARGAYGIGAWAQERASIVLERARIEEARMIGAGAIGEATLAATGLRIATVLSSACVDASCGDLAGGLGITAHFGGRVTVSDFEISGLEVCGVVVGGEGRAPGDTALDLARGVVRDTPIGACVQIDGYDTSRLRTDVEYRDVDVALQATDYRLPDAL